MRRTLYASATNLSVATLVFCCERALMNLSSLSPSASYSNLKKNQKQKWKHKIITLLTSSSSNCSRIFNRLLLLVRRRNKCDNVLSMLRLSKLNDCKFILKLKSNNQPIEMRRHFTYNSKRRSDSKA